MKNLYIYKMSEYGKIDKEVWEDVKTTRDEGKIVAKRDSNYRLSHGQYKYINNLNKVIQQSSLWTEYISFNAIEITQEIKALLIQPFVDKYKKEQQFLQEKIDILEKIKTE